MSEEPFCIACHPERLSRAADGGPKSEGHISILFQDRAYWPNRYATVFVDDVEQKECYEALPGNPGTAWIAFHAPDGGCHPELWCSTHGYPYCLPVRGDVRVQVPPLPGRPVCPHR